MKNKIGILIVGGLTMLAGSSFFNYLSMKEGMKEGVKSAPIYSRTGDFNKDKIDDLIVEDSVGRKTVLFGIPSMLRDFVQKDIQYASLNTLRAACEYRGKNSTLTKESNDYLKGLEEAVERLDKEK